jgi:pilus assembly protein CpaC
VALSNFILKARANKARGPVGPLGKPLVRAGRLRRAVKGVIACFTALAFSAAQAQPADFMHAMNQGGSTVSLEINKGIALRLDAPASSVAVADPSIADVQVLSPRMIYATGRGIGETSIIAVDGSDNIILDRTVSVTHNLSRLRSAVQEFSPKSELAASSTDNAIILKGKVDSPVAAEKIQRLASTFLRGEQQRVINMMDTSASDQVMLKVRIVEVARSELKRFGINWESLLNTGSFVFGLANGRDFINDAGTFTRSLEGDNSFNISNRTGSANINAVIDALEDDGLVSILAEPNLTTRSGKAASFLAGGEYPIPVPGDDGQVTIEYRQFGVSLQFTPIVQSSDKITLAVLPEVSALSDEIGITGGDFGDIPGLTTRRASTTVDLGSGQTFAIAGLLRSDQSNNISKFPGLGDIPVLGALFRSSEFQNNQTELVILVTPYIVSPVSDPKQFATPLDGYTPPTDGERILLGKLQGDNPAPPQAADAVTPATLRPAEVFQGIGGQAGFVMR